MGRSSKVRHQRRYRAQRSAQKLLQLNKQRAAVIRGLGIDVVEFNTTMATRPMLKHSSKK